MRQFRISAVALALAVTLVGTAAAQQTTTQAPAPPAASATTTAVPPATPTVQTMPGSGAIFESETLGPIENAGTLRIRSGSGTVVTMQTGIARVAVGDDRLLAVHVLEPREILLQGLVPGRSTIFVWLTDGRRLRYDVVVVPKIDVLRSSLRELDPGIEAELSADSTSIVLRGDVPSERIAREAERLAGQIIGTDQGGAGIRIVNLLHFPAASEQIDQSLAAALESIDPRIHVRKIQIASNDQTGTPTVALVLEGRVRNITDLTRAITIADLQMGGNGGDIRPVEQNDTQQSAGTGAGGGLAGIGGVGSARIPQGNLATFVARGLLLRSGSGKVISFLEVDDLPQIMVSIRAVQVDRGKARELGVDYRIDAKHVSIGSFNHPGASILPTARTGVGGGRTGVLAGAGNLLASFVDQTVAITAAIDLLEQKTIARSVAEPNLTTLSGEQASVLVGGQIPIPTTTVNQVTALQGFSFQSFGVRLDIRPTLNPNGMIALELAPSIIKPSADLAVGGIPGFEVQTVQTQAKVAPGQSLVIGGLLSFDDSMEKRGIPGLSSIPVIKHLFSWQSKNAAEKELIFVITPRVMGETPAERPLDEVQWSTAEPLPVGVTPALPALSMRDDNSFRTDPPMPAKPNGVPADFPLQPSVLQVPNVMQPIDVNPVPVKPQHMPALVPGTAPATAPAPTTTTAPPPPAAAPSATTTTTTTVTTTTAAASADQRPTPQAPKQELPPPPTPAP